MRLRAAASILALPVGLVGACTSDLNAPDAYTEPSITAGGNTAGELGLDCDAFPEGAVGAEYDFSPTTGTPDDGTRTWSADGLPDGLEIDDASGRITGAPTTAGVAEVEFTVLDSLGMASATCDLVINDGLDVDVDLVVDDVPGCLRPGEQTLLDLVVDGTGDGTAITCDHPGGTGNGRRPAGISVDAETCEIRGEVMDDRFGTWVFIVRGTQSGSEVWVPYCVTNDDPSGYDIDIDHSGLGDEGIDGTLVPIQRRFNPDATLSVGTEGDPLFTVVDQGSCGGNSCFFGFAFSINASPFDAETFDIVRDEILLDDAGGGPRGFSHELEIAGPQVDDAFRDRPWTVNVALDYCLSDTDGPCDGAQNVRTNGNGNVDISILMVPE